MTDQFDWGELGSGWWLDAAKSIGASERHARFACCKHSGKTNTQSAREAGYGTGGEGSTRSEGYRLFRSNKVSQLLAMAVAESGGGYDGTVTKQESKSILSHLARGSDPSVRIKSIELLSKMERDEVAANAAPEPSLQDSLFGVINALPESAIGPALALGTFFNSVGSIVNFPWLTECAPIVAKNFPTEWGRWRSKEEGNAWAVSFLDQVANGPLLEGDELVSAVKARLPVRMTAAQLKTPELQTAAEGIANG
jgi:hypothetical protein